MNAGPENAVCPRGHLSSDPEYCSECGARMPWSSRTPETHTAPSTTCPDCGVEREHPELNFCEVCGYNFATGAHGEIAPVTGREEAVPKEDPDPAPTADGMVGGGENAMSPVDGGEEQVQQHWVVLVCVDASLRMETSPAAPEEGVVTEVRLGNQAALVGRPDAARGIAPEIALAVDDAVSRRHALLQPGPDGSLSVRDIGSANGTRWNGQELAAMVDQPLQPGDELTLGHWTRLRLERRSAEGEPQ